MSISKRILDLARANLTDFRSAFGADHLRDLLDSDPEEEVEISDDGESIGRRAGRKAREVRDAAEEAYRTARSRAGVRASGAPDAARERRRWYKTLELEPGADLKTVRQAYRRLLLQYHPDRHTADPDRLQAATEVTRKLTEAYNGLTRYLGG